MRTAQQRLNNLINEVMKDGTYELNYYPFLGTVGWACDLRYKREGWSWLTIGPARTFSIEDDALRDLYCSIVRSCMYIAEASDVDEWLVANQGKEVDVYWEFNQLTIFQEATGTFNYEGKKIRILDNGADFLYANVDAWPDAHLLLKNRDGVDLGLLLQDREEGCFLHIRLK